MSECITLNDYLAAGGNPRSHPFQGPRLRVLISLKLPYDQFRQDHFRRATALQLCEDLLSGTFGTFSYLFLSVIPILTDNFIAGLEHRGSPVSSFAAIRPALPLRLLHIT